MNISADMMASRVDDPLRDCSNTKNNDLSSGEQLTDGLYDNRILNDLNPRPHTMLSNTTTNNYSIENNELQPVYTMNIEPQLHESDLINRQNRLSLYKYQKDIRKQISEILEREKDNKKSEKSEKNSDKEHEKFTRHLSQTEAKTLFSQSQSSGSDIDTEKEIYTRCIQEGDNNLMFLCEPKKTLKTCYQQVGNNNVMVNLHMSMISNSCQILDDEGKIFKLDSDGEIWLEIKVRRKKDTTDDTSRLSSATTDSNNCESCSDESFLNTNMSKTCRVSTGVNCADRHCCREPVEHVDYDNYDVINNVDVRNVTDLREPILGSARGRRVHEAQEHSISSDGDEISLIANNVGPTLARRQLSSGQRRVDVLNDDGCSECHLVMVEEKPDSIFMQLETQNGGSKMQDYSNFEDLAPVKEVLRHRRVMDFLQNQTDNIDFDVSVIELEYQNEPLYNLENVHYINTPLHESDNEYSFPRQLERKPTLPPKCHISSSDIYEDITNALCNQKDNKDSEMSSTNIKTQESQTQLRPPVRNLGLRRLPPRRACENSDLSPLTDSLCDQESTSMVSSSPSTRSTGNKPVKTPIKNLPTPPHFRSKSSDATKDDDEDCETNKNKNLCWYHGKISNTTAKSMLKGMPSGSFLVRDSSDASGNHKYTLEFVDKDTVKRLKIISNDNKFSLKESDSTFDTMEELIQEAIRAGIELKEYPNSNEWRKINITPVNKPSPDND